MNTPNLKTCELVITYQCNNLCDNCIAQCTQAPAKHLLSVDDIEKWLDIDSKRFELITITGGEPTTHPDIKKICKLFIDRKKNYWMLSNESGKKTKAINMELELMGVPIGRALKEGYNNTPYIPVNDSPTDSGYPFALGCEQSFRCGVAYNYAGYFPCSAAAAMYRIFGYSPICTKSADLTDDLVTSSYPLFCKHCGFASMPQKRNIRQITSPTWKKTLEKYNDSL